MDARNKLAGMTVFVVELAPGRDSAGGSPGMPLNSCRFEQLDLTIHALSGFTPGADPHVGREGDLVSLPQALEACRRGLQQGAARVLSPAPSSARAEGHVELGLPERGLLPGPLARSGPRARLRPLNPPSVSALGRAPPVAPKEKGPVEVRSRRCRRWGRARPRRRPRRRRTWSSPHAGPQTM